MPLFLSANDCYRLIQRELPPGLFPDGSPSEYYWTAEAFSYGTVFAAAYANDAYIYSNFFPQTCDAIYINNWEIKVFGQINTQGLTLAARQGLILQKLQSTHGISINNIIQVINFTLPGLDFEVVCWCCGQGLGGWVLDVSMLDVETYLNYSTQFSRAVGPNLCATTWTDWGLTQQDWENLQLFAYTYEVRIYDQTLTTMQRAILNAALNMFEPARSNHVINDGLSSATDFLGDPLC